MPTNNVFVGAGKGQACSGAGHVYIEEPKVLAARKYNIPSRTYNLLAVMEGMNVGEAFRG